MPPSTLTRTRFGVITFALVLHAVTASAQSALPNPTPPVDWLDTNIGNAIEGGWAPLDLDLTVFGTGTDIWGSADSFHFTYEQMDGDGELHARVVAVTGPHDWSKAGLMIRQSLDPGSPHHFLLASKGKGLAYQRRLTQGGTSLHTSLGVPTTATYYRIVRTGTQVSLGMSSDGVNWKSVAEVQWPTGPTFIGFAVTSHSSSTTEAVGRFELAGLTSPTRQPPQVRVLAPDGEDPITVGKPFVISWEATDAENDIHHFSVYSGIEQSGQVTYEPIAECRMVLSPARSCTWNAAGPSSSSARVLVIATDGFNNTGRDESERFEITQPPPSLPLGWGDADIGDVSIEGIAFTEGQNITVSGSGADIWGTADAFYYARTAVNGNFTITARAAAVENVNPWTKAGLMIREQLTPGSRHASFFATPSTVKGTAFQYRLNDNGLSASVPGPASAPPVWLKLMRVGPAVTAYARRRITDPWTMVHRQVFEGLQDNLDAGLAISSHVADRLATAQFTDVSVESLPDWQLGTIASTGSGSGDGTIFGLFGRGADIWSVADSLAYSFIPWVGDGTMTARVRSLQNTHAWAKAGVMFRESLTPGSKHVFALLSAGHGANLQYRLLTGGNSAANGAIAGAAPGWVRLTRSGDTFTASLSVDGRTWKAIGTVTVPMGASVYVGIAHTSHNTTASGGAVFDDLRITP